MEQIIDKYRGDSTAMIAILHDLNAAFRYLPREALEIVSDRLSVPLSYLYSAATFYRSFDLEPCGEHEIQVCLGTACHVRGSERILDALSRRLGIKPGETTADGKFTLKRVNCLGACALGPLVSIDQKHHGHLTIHQAERLLEAYKDEHD
ncbi:MAG TPA: NAD(P)H-dependent oxidoreductase subunit E [Bacillota bacterium]|nr:NAD(P)H-dependent oxidoreductase subunit E [Bacillota bacterium]HQD52755.1 NAD(P)H-dependent oxidoreductase subunit E [Bacillota bacterium]